MTGEVHRLLRRLDEPGGRYLFSVALTHEEFDSQPTPTFGGKGHSRWLTPTEYEGLRKLIALLRTWPRPCECGWSVDYDSWTASPCEKCADIRQILGERDSVVAHSEEEESP